jgi:hypothetical protein
MVAPYDISGVSQLSELQESDQHAKAPTEGLAVFARSLEAANSLSALQTEAFCAFLSIV